MPGVLPTGLRCGAPPHRPRPSGEREHLPATQRTVLGRTPHGMHPAALVRRDGCADDWTPPPRGLLSCAVEVQS
jgi:hypothetical protein